MNLTWRQKPRTPRAWLALALLLAAGPLLNLVPIEIPLVFFYVLGSIPAILAFRLFGTAAGICCALLSGFALFFQVGHPYTMLWFSAEIAFLAAAEKFWHSRNLILNDALYWALIGAPFTVLVFTLIGAEFDVGLAIATKSCVNGIANTTVAWLLLQMLPLKRILLGTRHTEPVSLNHLLFSFMLAFLLIPGLFMTATHLKSTLAQTEHLITESLHEKATDLTASLPLWGSGQLLNTAESERETVRERLRQEWQRSAGNNNWKLILAENGRVLLSTDEQWAEGTNFTPGQNADMIAKGPWLHHRIPHFEKFITIAERWRQSSFMLIRPVELVPGWILAVERPVAPYLADFRWSAIRMFLALTALTYLALLPAWLLTRSISTPINQLTRNTEGLTEHPHAGEENVTWPETRIVEMARLTRNFRSMFEALQEKFLLLQQSRRTLEKRVEERTSELSRTNEALLKSEKRYQALTESSPVGIFHTDSQGQCRYVNQRWCEITGMEAENALGLGWIQTLHPEDRTEVMNQWQQAVRNKDSMQMEYRVQKRDGRTVWVFALASPQGETSFEEGGYIGTLTDISDRVAAENRLRENQNRLNQLAYHDILTDLPNRLLFQDRLEHALTKARRAGQRVALLFLDLDRFKNINDSLGHEWGDNLLCEVADRLRNCVRESDTVARLGGDEFMVILERVENLKQVAAVAQKILTRLTMPVEMQSYSLYATASIGISLFPNDGTDVESLMKCSDAAMYRAKELGRNNYQFYTADMNARAHELLLLETSLRQALERDQLVLHYQPQYDLNDMRLVGFEALVRWRHPEHGMISPADFIPLAEETGLIVPIGEWVLRTACEQNRAWQKQGLLPVRMAVNISARQFRQSGLIQQVSQTLHETGLDARWLELELTESMIMGNTENAIRTMQALNTMGVELAIDDFGSGYSSLAYLKRFPISKLKIDQSFVRDVMVDANDATIAASVIALAKSMQLEVIAEGIEDADQLAFLQKKGCHQGQGYLFSPPLPADKAIVLFDTATQDSSSDLRISR